MAKKSSKKPPKTEKKSKEEQIKAEMAKENFTELKQVDRQNLELKKINNEIVFMDIDDGLTKKPIFQDS